MTSERDEMRRHFGVLAEDVLSQLRMVAEGNAVTAEAVQRLDNKVDALGEETRRSLATVGTELGAVRSEAKAFREETARNFAAVHTEFASVRGRLDGIDGRLDGLDKRMDGLDGFRAETARNFMELRAETGSSRKDFDRRLKVVEARQTSRR
jgi:hypothetical protein